MCRQGAAEYNFGQELKEEIEAMQHGKLGGFSLSIAMPRFSPTDFRSEGTLSGVPPTLVAEDDEQEGERRQRRLQGGHEGLSDIGGTV